jgi:threonine/homoserine/homoserine lactone efflux protein
VRRSLRHPADTSRATVCRFAPVGDVIGQMLPIAVGIAVSPLPIVAVVLMLATPRGRADGPAFLAAWIVGLAAIGAIVIAAVGDSAEDDSGGTPGWVSGLKLALGLLLLVFAAKQWRERPRGDAPAELPKWMGALDTFGPGKALGVGVALSLLNPKNLLLAIAGATVIAQGGLTAGQEAGALAIFVAIATIGVATPVVLYFAMGDRSREILDAMKDWMARNNAVIMAVLMLIIGVKLIGDAISGFAG